MKGDPMDMFDQMDEMFARLFSQMSRDMPAGGPKMYGYHIVIDNGDAKDGLAEIPSPAPRSAREPVAEVHRIGNETKVITEIPGAAEDSIRLTVRGTTLVIDAGESESHYRTTAEIPGTDAASMTRSFKNGVLEVTFRNSGESPAGFPQDSN